MKQDSNIERFHTCYRCKGTNTEQIGMADNFSHYQFVGWCFDCRDDYGYRLNISTVWDKENRI